MGQTLQPLWRWFHRWTSPREFYRLSRSWARIMLVLGLAGLLVGWVWGLVFAPEDYQQGNSYRIIFIHVPSASVVLTLYFAMAACALVALVWQIKLAHAVIRQAIPIGFTLTALALFTGAVWGKPTWGTYWIWDARLTSMLIQLFLFAGLWALYVAIEDQRQADRAVAILTLVGVVNLPIIKFSVEWWNTLHQPATLRITRETTMTWDMLAPLLLCLAATYVLTAAMVLLRTRWELLYRERKTRWAQDDLSRLERA